MKSKDSFLNIDTSSNLPISDSFQDTDNLKPEVPIHHGIDKVRIYVYNAVSIEYLKPTINCVH